jgi:SAM-dependent methyltransferase
MRSSWSEVSRLPVPTASTTPSSGKQTSMACRSRNGSFDRVFSNALLEHLSEPVAALSEMKGVLRPGGVIGVAAPDWGGFIFAPSGRGAEEAVELYQAVQRKNGGNPASRAGVGNPPRRGGFPRHRARRAIRGIRGNAVHRELPRNSTGVIGRGRRRRARPSAHSRAVQEGSRGTSCVGRHPACDVGTDVDPRRRPPWLNYRRLSGRA